MPFPRKGLYVGFSFETFVAHFVVWEHRGICTSHRASLFFVILSFHSFSYVSSFARVRRGFGLLAGISQSLLMLLWLSSSLLCMHCMQACICIHHIHIFSARQSLSGHPGSSAIIYYEILYWI